MIKEQNHDKEHIHIMVVIPPKYRVGQVVGFIKTNTGRAMKKEFKFLKKCYYGTNSVWSGDTLFLR